ncbi:MAG: hypothetical protein AAFY02_05600 [Pseudomonadota bacterium]
MPLGPLPRRGSAARTCLFRSLLLASCLLLPAVAAQAQSTPVIDTHPAQPQQWNSYLVYDPVIEHDVIYDAEIIKINELNGFYETVDPSQANPGLAQTWLDRVVLDSEGVPVIQCGYAPEAGGTPPTLNHCVQQYTDTDGNDTTWRMYWNNFTGPNIYNHMANLAYFKGRWYAAWGSNDKKITSEAELVAALAAEASPGEPVPLPNDFRPLPGYGETEGGSQQRILLTTSTGASFPRTGVSGSSWTEPSAPYLDLMKDAQGNRLTSARQWVPVLLPVDFTRDPVADPGEEPEELWHIFTQTLGNTDLYLSRITRDGEMDAIGAPVPLVKCNKLNADIAEIQDWLRDNGAPDTELPLDERFARSGPLAIQLADGGVALVVLVRGYAARFPGNAGKTVSPWDLKVFYAPDVTDTHPEGHPCAGTIKWQTTRRFIVDEDLLAWEPILV